MKPRHIGFIMDGNGRWAQSRGLERAQGYAEGVVALYKVAKRCAECGVEAISVFALSTENLARPDNELNAIYKAIEKFNYAYEGDFVITYMGDVYSLPDSVAESIENVEDRTADNGGLKLNIAVNYGGRADIIHAAKVCYDHGEFVEDTFLKHLSSSHLPQLDMIVRTGGEMRLSNFMLFESAYAELLFLDTLWPDMDEEKVNSVIEEFEKRDRKFGK